MSMTADTDWEIASTLTVVQNFSHPDDMASSILRFHFVRDDFGGPFLFRIFRTHAHDLSVFVGEIDFHEASSVPHGNHVIGKSVN